MTKIFKHLAKHWAACLVIIALLLVQAYGDLTLPDYTSKIVDTGIQQSGIADAVPEVVRDSTLQVLELLMTDADAAAVEAAYTQPGGTDNALSSATSLQKKLASPYTVRLLRADADRDTLAEVFSTPDIVLYLASAQAAGEGNAPAAAALDTVTAQFAAMTQMPGFSRDAVQAQLAAAMGQAGESELSGLSAQAVLLVGLEYQALGISDAVQMNYLMQTGGRMLGLTLLMVAAAVLVGLLASRVAAAIARDLRRGVFRRVVSFSASETDKFSTASLITRTTNDVQQIQMTCVILLRMVAYAPHPWHWRHHPCGTGGFQPDLDHCAGRRFAAGADYGIDAVCHAQVQDHAKAGGPAEPGIPRDFDRHYAHPRIQPRTARGSTL